MDAFSAKFILWQRQGHLLLTKKNPIIPVAFFQEKERSFLVQFQRSENTFQSSDSKYFNIIYDTLFLEK